MRIRVTLYRLLEVGTRSLLTYAAALAFFAVPVLTVRGIAAGSREIESLVGFSSAAAAIAVVFVLRERIAGAFEFAADRAQAPSTSTWIFLCLGIGMALRLAWVWAFPAAPSSDGATYLSLARGLLAGEDYEAAGTRAYWPPGYPFYLLPWLALVPGASLAVLLSNLALFAVGSAGVWVLGSRLTGERGARLALAIYAIWPNYVFQAGLPEKEQVIIALLPWLLALALPGPAADVRRTLLAGLVLGFCTLVQPAFQLFPVVLLVYWLATAPSVLQAGTRFAALILGIAVVVAPWTFRNARVLGEPVLVATNGGSTLYRANNPLATGGYTERGEVDLAPLSELEADREGRRLAREWILSNPLAFVHLAFEKNVRFMGDDAAGAYQTLKRGGAGGGAAVYLVAKGVANAFWLALSGLLLAALCARWRLGIGIEPAALCVPLSFAYLFLIHTVFESTGKYHVPLIGILAVTIPLYCLGMLAVRKRSG
jgi:hypothetical protein